MDGTTPDDIFDCYKDELLKSLNNMKNSKLLSGEDDDHFDRFKYYKVENEARVTLISVMTA